MKTLHEPPTADPHGGWCGGWGLEASGYPIRPHFAQMKSVLSDPVKVEVWCNRLLDRIYSKGEAG